ncbi:hypothetical protein LCGC14_2191770 [marine sediment metagenome]|uniref:Uncharacterized protein n=1 Tax=marine sediment metagenome TaxID=412755 RepID=A0A0F9DJJ7_9ZZZZ
MNEQSKDVLDRYLRPILKELLAQCNDGNRRKFDRIYRDVETMDSEKIPYAISVCERTIKKNIEQALKAGE